MRCEKPLEVIHVCFEIGCLLFGRLLQGCLSDLIHGLCNILTCLSVALGNFMEILLCRGLQVFLRLGNDLDGLLKLSDPL